MNRTTTIAFCLLLLGAPALAQEMEFADTVYVLDETGAMQTIENVKVQSATYEEVKFAKGRNQLTREGRLVVGISYGDAPRIYAQALQALGRRQYAEAASDFDGAKNAAEVGRAREWVLEYAALKKALCLLALGRVNRTKLPDAIAEFEKALKANPKSLLLNDIETGLAEAHALLGEWDKAKEAAAALKAAGEAISHPVWKAQAQRSVARALLAQKNYDQARAAFQELVRLARSELQYKSWEIGEKNEKVLKNLQIEGAVEQGWVIVAWAESGSSAMWSEARTYFTGLGKDADYAGNDLVAAAVLNGIGRCMLDESPREALEMFIKAEVTRFGAAAEVARSLYLKALAYEKLGGSRNEEMARKARKELEEFYPGSVWAGK